MPSDPEDRIVSSQISPEEDPAELTLRPRQMTEFVGQATIKQNLNIYIQAARGRNEALDHVLLSGPPGLGKTTMAHLIAEGMGSGLKATSGPALEKAGDLVGILTSLEGYEVLFIDEIHRLSSTVEELLYSAMEDQVVDLIIDSGPNARTVTLNLKPFTLVGATTREGLLSAPLRSRFGIVEKFNLYPAGELEQLIKRSAGILSVDIDDQACQMLASRARGTPRIANRILRRVRDLCQVKGLSVIDSQVAEEGLSMLGVDANGLDAMDRQILKILAAHEGTPVGLKTLSVSVGEEESTIEDVYEPYLIREQFILKSARGRLATERTLSLFGQTKQNDGLFS